MKKYFGTDGIRGKVNENLTPQIAFRCANALGKMCKSRSPKIVIGTDTRKSKDLFVTSFAAGLMSEGVDVVYVGIAPTPAISYLTRHLNACYGVEITASHNPAYYNGIKIFDSSGSKLSIKQELLVEKNFSSPKYKNYEKIGKFKYSPGLKKAYINYLLSLINKNINMQDFANLKIAIDCSYGATSYISKKVFSSFCPHVVFLNTKYTGTNINENCGATSPQKLCEFVKEHNFDLGFSFDGDGDRCIACDNCGNIVDGDKILTIFAKNLKLANNNNVVGTILTNLGIEKELNRTGIKLLRADVGDRNVAETIQSKNLSLGAETCGHVIIYDYAKTGDGILCALKLCEVCILTKRSLSKLANIKLTYTKNIDCIVTNKKLIMENKSLLDYLNALQKKTKAKIVVRASGTEEKIRILVDSHNKKDLDLANQIKQKIESLCLN